MDMQLQRIVAIVSQQLQNLGAKVDSHQTILQTLLQEPRGKQMVNSSLSTVINALNQNMHFLH